MYRILVPTEKSKYELSELAKMFVPENELDILSLEEPHFGGFDLKITSYSDKNKAKRELYNFFKDFTGYKPEWGILTGVRPLKLYNELVSKYGRQEAAAYLSRSYYVSEEKLSLLIRTSLEQEKASWSKDTHAVAIYVGIPFCPTRCVYCSFTSNKISDQAAKAYMKALVKEIDAVKAIMEKHEMYAESIYIGGGTPTSLADDDFRQLLSEVSTKLKSDKTVEFTVEAGRPDTVTEEKLAIIREYGGGRISINPQSMKQHTLDLIGRSHSPEDIYKAFELARKAEIPVINCDLIAGLPEEEPEDFYDSLEAMLELKPENITVHTLAVKKASRLIEEKPDFAYEQGNTVRKMLEYAAFALDDEGYSPYYLYRQKHMAGNFENVGYCKDGLSGIYNIRIMEENQTVIALGAGAVGKIFFPAENRIERVPNVSNYEIYIDRIDEMIERKEQAIYD